ncbi:MAG: RIP metalloprotease RseP [Myxococcales bacterium]|nr:RIP metalloprotease RseP [Polyangiaceae bacterium]MDW8249769.1 RIP metalloprotease RseP [Myxococcales bacterium]
MDLLYFVILVSVLIFVHELGHFTFAKIFGIKVLTFSVGFGPKILRLRGRETEYCVGLFPLGGFVRMLEESRGEPVLPEDRRRTFEAQPIWRRVLVVLAGPVMNLIFPVVLYFSVFASEQWYIPPTVGVVLPGHPAEGKLLEGDRVLEVDGNEIGTFVELQRYVAQNPGREIKLKVFRSLGYVDVEVTPEEVREPVGYDQVASVGRLGILPHAYAPAIGVSNPDSPAYRAGLRTFDVLTSIGGRPLRHFSDIAKVLADNRGETVPVTYLRPRLLEGALGGFADLAAFEPGVAALTPESSGGDLFSRTGIESSDLFVAIVPPGSAQAKANIQRGDKLIKLDDEPIPSWSVLRERLFAEPTKPHKLTYVRDGRQDAGTIQLRHELYVDESGQSHERYALRMEHWAPTVPEPLVEHPHRYTHAARIAVTKTAEVARYMVVSIVQVVQGKIGLSQISGPIAIYEVAGQEGARGTEYFLWVMAVISINLGLLNLMPIPVLDGGHLLFLASEAALRRPLPLRVREVASLIGMMFLLMLMAVAFKNDVERRWDTIAGELKELLG